MEPIGRSQKNRQLMCTYEGLPGKPAVSHVRTLAFDGKISVCLVRIETGRLDISYNHIIYNLYHGMLVLLMLFISAVKYPIDLIIYI